MDGKCSEVTATCHWNLSTCTERKCWAFLRFLKARVDCSSKHTGLESDIES